MRCPLGQAQVVVPALEHDYRHGFQHSLPKSEVSVKSVHGTMIVWLQNDQGYQRWGPTEVEFSFEIIFKNFEQCFVSLLPLLALLTQVFSTGPSGSSPGGFPSRPRAGEGQSPAAEPDQAA